VVVLYYDDVVVFGVLDWVLVDEGLVDGFVVGYVY